MTEKIKGVESLKTTNTKEKYFYENGFKELDNGSFGYEVQKENGKETIFSIVIKLIKKSDDIPINAKTAIRQLFLNNIEKINTPLKKGDKIYFVNDDGKSFSLIIGKDEYLVHITNNTFIKNK